MTTYSLRLQITSPQCSGLCVQPHRRRAPPFAHKSLYLPSLRSTADSPQIPLRPHPGRRAAAPASPRLRCAGCNSQIAAKIAPAAAGLTKKPCHRSRTAPAADAAPPVWTTNQDNTYNPRTRWPGDNHAKARPCLLFICGNCLSCSVPTMGSTFELSNKFDHAWLNGANQYVMSEDPNFNPNGNLGGNWTQLQVVQPQP